MKLETEPVFWTATSHLLEHSINPKLEYTRQLRLASRSTATYAVVRVIFVHGRLKQLPIVGDDRVTEEVVEERGLC